MNIQATLFAGTQPNIIYTVVLNQFNACKAVLLKAVLTIFLVCIYAPQA